MNYNKSIFLETKYTVYVKSEKSFMQEFSLSNIELKFFPLRKNMYFLGCPEISQKIALSQNFNISSLVFARMSIDNRVLGQYANLDFRI